MPDEPIIAPVPVPLRPPATGRVTAPADAVVRGLHASLRAADVYARVLADQIELAQMSGRKPLDAVSPDALVRLTAVSDALHSHATRVLLQLDPDLARTAETLVDLARQGTGSPAS